MNTARQDLSLGLVLSSLFALAFFVLVPHGIDVPQSHDPGQISPSAYPSWIALAGFTASLLLTLSSAWRCFRASGPRIVLKSDSTWAALFPGATGFMLLFAFYLCIDTVGMLLGSFILYAVFALLCGERNYIRLLLANTLLTAVLYLFFVRIAAVPIPMGILEGTLQM